MGCLFNQTTYNAEYLLIGGGDPASLRDIDPLTVSAWIYCTGWGANSYGRIICKEATTSGWVFFVSNAGAANGVQTLAFVRNRAIISTNVRGANNALSLNAWYHVAVTYQSAGTVLYVNGTALSTVTYTAGSGSINSDSGYWLMIGNRDLTFDREFDGRIEDVRIFNRYLSATEIATLWKARGMDSIHYSEIGRWQMKRGAPGVSVGTNKIADLSNNANHAYMGLNSSAYTEWITGKRAIR